MQKNLGGLAGLVVGVLLSGLTGCAAPQVPNDATFIRNAMQVPVAKLTRAQVEGVRPRLLAKDSFTEEERQFAYGIGQRTVQHLAENQLKPLIPGGVDVNGKVVYVSIPRDILVTLFDQGMRCYDRAGFLIERPHLEVIGGSFYDNLPENPEIARLGAEHKIMYEKMLKAYAAANPTCVAELEFVAARAAGQQKTGTVEDVVRAAEKLGIPKNPEGTKAILAVLRARSRIEKLLPALEESGYQLAEKDAVEYVQALLETGYCMDEVVNSLAPGAKEWNGVPVAAKRLIDDARFRSKEGRNHAFAGELYRQGVLAVTHAKKAGVKFEYGLIERDFYYDAATFAFDPLDVLALAKLLGGDKDDVLARRWNALLDLPTSEATVAEVVKLAALTKDIPLIGEFSLELALKAAHDPAIKGVTGKLGPKRRYDGTDTVRQDELIGYLQGSPGGSTYLSYLADLFTESGEKQLALSCRLSPATYAATRK